MPPVIPSQREQMETIQEAESADAPSAFSMPQAGEAPAGPAPIHVPGASPPIPAPAPAREIAQEDIDAALQAWNGDTASKRRVQQYMTAHAREKDTAAWLRTEYGGELPMFPVQLPGTEQYQHLPWPKVQRRIAQLVKEDRFFTETELANFDDIDTSAVREQLEQEPRHRLSGRTQSAHESQLFSQKLRSFLPPQAQRQGPGGWGEG